MTYFVLIAALSLVVTVGLMYGAKRAESKMLKAAVIIGIIANAVFCAFLIGYVDGKFNIGNIQTDIMTFLLIFEALFLFDELKKNK